MRFLTYDEIRTLLAKLRAATKVDILVKAPVAVPGAAKEPANANAAPAPAPPAANPPKSPAATASAKPAPAKSAH